MMDRGASGWFKSLNCDGRYGLALLATGLLLAALMLGGEPWQMALRFDRAGLHQGQWWRLITGNLVHFDIRHLLLDFTGLALLWMLFAREFTPRRWAGILLASCAAIDAGLWFLRPEVEWYAGASGVLHGALAAGAVAWYRRGEGLGAALVLLLIVKLVYEQHSSASVFMQQLPLMPDAHLFGALGGLLGAWLPRRSAKPL